MAVLFAYRCRVCGGRVRPGRRVWWQHLDADVDGHVPVPVPVRVREDGRPALRLVSSRQKS